MIGNGAKDVIYTTPSLNIFVFQCGIVCSGAYFRGYFHIFLHIISVFNWVLGTYCHIVIKKKKKIKKKASLFLEISGNVASLLYSLSFPNGIEFLNTFLLFVSNHGNCKNDMFMCSYIPQRASGIVYIQSYDWKMFCAVISVTVISVTVLRDGYMTFCILWIN